MFFRKILNFFWDLVEVVVFSGAIFLVLYLLVLQPHKIKGSSMEPSFLNGQYLLTDKVSYRIKEPQRGDIVVFKAPSANGEEFIKRIVALPGETIELKDGKLYINDVFLFEEYISEGTYIPGGFFLKERQRVTVPAGKYFVMGDNRLFSSDSRAWGFIGKKEITGRAWLVYWPISKLGLIKNAEYKKDPAFSL